MRRSSFVNLELQIAVAVVGILLAIAIPVAARLLEKFGYSKYWSAALVPALIGVVFLWAVVRSIFDRWMEKRIQAEHARELQAGQGAKEPRRQAGKAAPSEEASPEEPGHRD